MTREPKSKSIFTMLLLVVSLNAGAQTTITNSLKLRIHVDESDDVKEYEFNLSPGVSAGIIDPRTGEFYPDSELLGPEPDETSGRRSAIPQ
jgi:hypothetical protein